MDSDFELKRYEILGIEYILKLSRFSDRFGITCYNGFDFTLTSDKFKISGVKYDEDDYITFNQQPMIEAKFRFKDVKEILHQAFNVRKFEYVNRKHSCTWHWCYKLEDGIWYGTRSSDGKVRLYDNNDVLRYEGELLEGAFHGYGKLFNELGEIVYEGKFVHGCF